MARAPSPGPAVDSAATATTRVLVDRDLDAATQLMDKDPISNVYVASRVRASGLDPWRLGGEVWGHVVDGRLDALCYAGANLVPVQANREATMAFAERACRQGRRCSSILGPAESAGLLWDRLEPVWGPARDIRPHQPLMATSSLPAVAPDPLVRRVLPAELDTVLPACVAMFTEEIGISPLASDGGTLYRARVSELIRSGWSFARIENGRVLFKAEVGAVSSRACQVQGVWVAPELRGRGLSVGGMATVVSTALREIAPIVTLYVNDYNLAARAAYQRVGFTEVGTFMSVLF